MTSHPAEHDQQQSPAALLARLGEQRLVARRAEVAQLEAIVAWAALHPATTLDDAACETEAANPLFGDRGLPLGGPGVPLVSEFAVLELAAALGRSPASGRHHIAKTLELAHRLPHLWALVRTAERVEPWQALRVAEHTIGLSPEAAAYIDRHLTPVAGRIGPTQLERLVDQARTRFDPHAAEELRAAAAEQRHLTIETRHATANGTVDIHGTSTSPTHSTSTTPSTTSPPSSPSSAARKPPTYAAPSPSASSPATNPPSTSTTATRPPSPSSSPAPPRAAGPARSCSTPTSRPRASTRSSASTTPTR